MKVAICDDVREYRLTVRAYTEAFFKFEHPQSVEIDEYESGKDLTASAKIYDIVFLDIELGDTNGIDVAKKLIDKNKNTIVIIATSYNQYLDAAMDLHVLRFINKPVTKEKAFSALSRALSEIDENIISVNLKNKQIVRLKLSEIVYVEAKHKNVNIYTLSDIYTSTDSMKIIKPLLSSSFFASPHNSYVVNLNYVKSYKRNEIILSSPYEDVKISIAMRRQPEFKKEFLDFIGEGIDE